MLRKKGGGGLTSAAGATLATASWDCSRDERTSSAPAGRIAVFAGVRGYVCELVGTRVREWAGACVGGLVAVHVDR